MNTMQKIVDAGLIMILLILLAAGTVAIVKEHRVGPGRLHTGGPITQYSAHPAGPWTRYSYRAAAFLGCDMGPGPTLQELSRMMGAS